MKHLFRHDTTRNNVYWSVVVGVLVLSASVDANAGGVRFVGEGHAANPVWSADGKHLAFEVDAMIGNIDLFVAEVAGDKVMKDAQKVTLPGMSGPFGGGTQVVVNPTWHPEGLVVFEGSNQGGKYRLYYYQPGGGVAAEMITSQQIAGELTSPTIASDGQTMAFVSDINGSVDLRVWDANTDNIEQLTTTPEPELLPIFSKDGSRVLFNRSINQTEDLYMIDVATRAEKRVAGGGGHQSRANWAENGRMVFFDASSADSGWSLMTAAEPGGATSTLARGVALPIRARPAVSPDGKWVAFSYVEPSKSNMIVLKKVDGTKTVNITTSFTACREPSLGVQGDRLLLAYTALPTDDAAWRFVRVKDITDQVQ